MFVDVAKISVKSGDGGNGAVSFHREKYIANGGPDGGDGGKGGSVIFKMDRKVSTLSNFRFKKRYVAESGEGGKSNRSFGKSGKDLVIKVPKGTLIKDASTGDLLADISSEGDFFTLRGGKGGFGNSHFATSVRQAPRFAKPGECGLELELQLELKLLADVGLVGFPNVGKSTLISRVSEAKPKIANYHFTTLSPVLGVVRHKDHSFVMADIPGLIENAHQGSGLGDTFLRHVERCRLLLHVVDISCSEGRNPENDFFVIKKELEKFSDKLAKKPFFVVGSKCDLASEEQIKNFKTFVENNGLKFFPISSAVNFGIGNLLDAIINQLSALSPIERFLITENIDFEQQRKLKERRFEIIKCGESYEVKSIWLAKVVSMLDFEDRESLLYLRKVLELSGVNSALKRAGALPGSTIKLGGFIFEFLE